MNTQRVPRRAFERFSPEHLWALHNALTRPQAISWLDDVLAEVLMELQDRGAITLKPRTEGSREEARW